jgi:hypothetical protein
MSKARETRLAEYRKSLRIEHEGLVRQMREEALLLTSGRTSTAMLRAARHPFRRKKRHLIKMHYQKLPINRQTGRLQKSLRVFRRDSQGRQVIRLQFTAPHSAHVLADGGTRSMIARGFRSVLRARYLREVETMSKQTLYAARLAGLKRKYAKIGVSSAN